MTREKGINLLDLKRENRKQILLVLKKYGALPRKEIAQRLGLTPAAVTIITNEMLEEGILMETAPRQQMEKQVGRKTIPIEINYDVKYVAGVSIDSENINIGLCNMRGQAVDRLTIALPQQPGTETDILKIIRDSCMQIFWRNDVHKKNILGMGVGVIGPVDAARGISKNTYGILEKNKPVKDTLEKYLNIPVCVDNNVRTLALAEISLNTCENNSDMIFVKYGPGIGAAIVINNEIFVGNSNNAGELGHIIVKYQGEKCRCGKRGCLETEASPDAILLRVKELFSRKCTPILFGLSEGKWENVNLFSLFESMRQGEKDVASILAEAAFYFATALSTAVTLYDPDKVVLYGEIFQYDEFTRQVKAYLHDMLGTENPDSMLQVSRLEYQDKFLGGAALVLKELFYNKGGKFQKDISSEL